MFSGNFAHVLNEWSLSAWPCLVMFKNTWTPYLIKRQKEKWRKTYMLSLTLSWRRPISYRNHIWFLYDISLRHERVNKSVIQILYQSAITCSKLTIETLEQGVKCQWRRFGIFIVNFEHISHLVLVFSLLTLRS